MGRLIANVAAIANGMIVCGAVVATGRGVPIGLIITCDDRN